MTGKHDSSPAAWKTLAHLSASKEESGMSSPQQVSHQSSQLTTQQRARMNYVRDVKKLLEIGKKHPARLPVNHMGFLGTRGCGKGNIVTGLRGGGPWKFEVSGG
eukprot:448503-Hanusia_phi.AAC.1